MEYERTDDGQIQAAFAYRAGQILLQYEQFSSSVPFDQRYEATLAVSLLQSLLTSCQEVIRAKGKTRLQTLAKRNLLDDPAQMGLDANCVLNCWPSTRGLTYREVFECLRNALSHPGAQGNSDFPRTGFTTEQAGSASVTAYIFTQSSWVNSTGSALLRKYAPVDRDSSAKDGLVRLMTDWGDNHKTDGLVVLQDGEGRWHIVRGGNLFVPVLQLRLDVQQLRTLTLTLCDYLSHSVHPLVGEPA